LENYHIGRFLYLVFSCVVLYFAWTVTNWIVSLALLLGLWIFGAMIEGILQEMYESNVDDKIKTLEKKLSSKESQPLMPLTFNGEKDVTSNAYIIFLTKKFNIEFHDALKKYIVKDELFENLNDALKFAKTLDVDVDFPVHPKDAIANKGAKTEFNTQDVLFKIFVFLGIAVLVIGISIFIKINNSNSVDTNEISVDEIFGNDLSSVEVKTDNPTLSSELIQPNETRNTDQVSGGANQESKSIINQIEFSNNLDEIGKRWDVILSSAASNDIILSENLAPLYREVNILVNQPSETVSSWYCTILSVHRGSFFCSYKSYYFSVEVKPSEVEKLRHLKSGVIVSFSGVLMSGKFENWIVQEWQWSKPKIKIIEATVDQQETIAK